SSSISADRRVSRDVFIVRPADPSSAGHLKLANALAQRFHLDEKIVRKYLASGRRIRVKGGLDERTAQGLARELEGLGAVVPVEAPPEPYTSGLAAASGATSDGKVLEALANIESLTISSLDGVVVEVAIADDSLSRPTPVPTPKPAGTDPPARGTNPPPRPSGTRQAT